MTKHPFTLSVIKVISSIPMGKVATYGGVAGMAGNARAARQVVRILHTSSEQENLPWHRVINKEGRISLRPMQGGDEQRKLLEREGVEFDAQGRIDLERFLWCPGRDVFP
jgi:methylated-DNA-protein-cysteine methyltransferase-like protein